MLTFKDNNRAFQELVREIFILRKTNEKNIKKQTELLLFAEGSLVLIAFERFLRMFLNDFGDEHTLYNLLEIAVKNGIKIDAIENQKAIKAISNLRNAILHGNFEKAAKDTDCLTVEEYFKRYYIAEIEFVYNLLDNIIKQVNINTGKLIDVSHQNNT